MIKKNIRLAVFGCGHGKLDNMYSSIDPSKGVAPPDLVIINGDFQAIRNPKDLYSMAVPQKYRELGDFHKYYSGEKKAPYLTIIIGGNHEASNYMSELSYGGWLAPNMYYLGLSNVIEFGPLKIGGWSGIYNYGNYLKGYTESLPYSPNDLRSIYHVREFQYYKLNHFTSPIDVFLSHDWPTGITDYGNVEKLLKIKPFFREDISNGKLGSPPSMNLLKKLKPRWWFGSHLHCRFTAEVHHPPLTEHLGASFKNEDEIELEDLDSSSNQPKLPVKNEDEIDLDDDEEVIHIKQKSFKNEDEIDLDDEDDEIIYVQQKLVKNGEKNNLDNEERSTKRFKSPTTTNPTNTNTTTQFLALDKCLPRRSFMEIVEIPITTTKNKPLELHYNLEWLAIVKAFNELTPFRPTRESMIYNETEITTQITNNLNALQEAAQNGSFNTKILDNFTTVAPTLNESNGMSPGEFKKLGQHFPNPQTEEFCDKLGILNKFL